MSLKKKPFHYLLLFVLLTSCSTWKVDSSSNLLTPSYGTSPSDTPIILSPGAGGMTATPFQPVNEPYQVFISGGIPQEWRTLFREVPVTDNSISADLIFSPLAPKDGHIVGAVFQRVYALVAPFDTVTDGISLNDLQTVWQGGETTASFSSLIMEEQTSKVFSELWQLEASQNVKIVSKEEIVSQVWNNDGTWAIIPFEEIKPRYKVMRINGISPFDRPMDADHYPLIVSHRFYGSQAAIESSGELIEQLVNVIPSTNRDEAKITIIMMTGTTAIARVTLRKIELNDYDYPIEFVRDWFLSADLRHVSNEVSFNEECVFTDAYTMSFCSKPDQIKVLENIGVNVVESTGNHMNDYGADAFSYTLGMYQDRGWLNFGGGINAEAAKQPALTEVNGNKVAFIGCNPIGFTGAWATDTQAGAAKCDYDFFNQKISELKSQGYIVIATFQETEIDLPMYDEHYRTPFKEAALAGADIVQGSQAHVPMGFEFVDDHFIHYGLGNFLFDQMEPINTREFYDRHIIYDGNYLGTELLTANLTDWSQPVPMTQNERISFLQEIFDASDMR